jgi:hypothetical protein
MNIQDNVPPLQGGWLALVKGCSPTPRYWLGWTALQPTELLSQIVLVSPYPVLLLWSQPGEEEDAEELTYPVIQHWIPDTDWFELPHSVVNEICARKVQI